MLYMSQIKKATEGDLPTLPPPKLARLSEKKVWFNKVFKYTIP